MTHKITENSLNLIRNELLSVEWETYLASKCTNTSDVDSMFNCVHGKICDSINQHAPMKENIVHECKLKSEPWMTLGIKCSSQKLRKMYKACLKPAVNSVIREAYISYRNCLNKLKRTCKLQYYRTHCEQYKKNTRKL